MANPSWQSILGDPSVDGALEVAADRFVRDGCAHPHRDDQGHVSDDPAWCNCAENRVDPREFLDWLRDEIKQSGARPIRFERGARPFRAKRYPNLLKAVAAG